MKLGATGLEKDCLDDETYQPQFLVCLPLAQRDSLPHALFGWSLLPVLAMSAHKSIFSQLFLPFKMCAKFLPLL